MICRAFFVVLLLLVARPARGQLTDGIRVHAIRFEIPEGIEEQEVKALMQTVAGQPLVFAALDADVRRLYLTLPVENVLVYAEEVSAGVALRLVLLPKKTVRDIRFVGNHSLDDQELLSVLDLKEGTEYQEDLVAKALVTIKRRYETEGFFGVHTATETRMASDRAVDILVRVREGPQARVGRITLVGAQQPWISDAFELRTGRLYSKQALANARDSLIEELAKRGYLEHKVSEPAVTYNAATNRVGIALSVDPGPRIDFRFVGNHFFSTRDLRDMLGLEDLRHLPLGGSEEFVRNIVEHYQRYGFFFAHVTVERQEASDGSARTYWFRVHEGEQRFIREVAFEGNLSIPHDRLYAAQAVRVRGPLSFLVAPQRGTFPLSLQTVNDEAILQEYRKEGFLSAQILVREIQPRDDGLRLVYRISEGPRTRVEALEFTGNQRFDAYQLARELGVTRGTPFDPRAVDQGVERIRALYREEGYLDANVEAKPTLSHDNRLARLNISVREGPRYRVGQIFLQGNTRTSDSVLRRNLILQTGDVINPNVLLDAQRKLYSLGIFGAVAVDVVSKDPQAQVANVLVRVQERRNGSVDFGIGVGTAEGASLTAEVGHRNLWGTARSLRLLGEVSYRFEGFDQFRNPNEYQVEMAYREPWLLRSDWAGRVITSTQRSRREKTYNFTINRVLVGGDRELGAHWRIVPQYVWEKDTFFPKNPAFECNPFCELPNINLPRGAASRTYYIAGVENFFVADYRDDRFSPRSGWLATGRVFYAQPKVGADFHFLRLDGMYGQHWSLGDGWGVSLGARVGNIWLLPPTTRLIKTQKYVLGGVNSVRGFGLDRIFVPAGPESEIPSGEDGGLIMTNYQLELRFPLLWHLGGVIFHDGGQVWPDWSSVGFPVFLSAGTGLRYDTPVGPLKLDIGWKLNPEQVTRISAAPQDRRPYEIHFAIGSVF